MQLRAALRAVGDAAELVVSPVGLVADEVPSQRAGRAETAHRPWPLPARAWLMGQTWYSLLFAHWAVRPEALRPLVPQPLELDLREGQAWLGVTPFVVGGLRLRGTPPLPRLSRYESERIDSSGPPARLRACYGPTGPRLPVDDGSLERWLAERYRLYVVDERGRALRADIHHPPWPLQPAGATIELNTMARPLGLELISDPLLHYSARQDTLIWPLEAA